MNPRAAHLQDMGPSERERALADAADALRDGRLVVMPTETVYGLFANAASTPALEALAGATGADWAPGAARERPAFVWHAPDGKAVRERLDLPTPVARRLLTRLAPGPVRFEIEQPEAKLAAWRADLGVEPGVIDAGGVLAVRVPEHPVARRVLADAGVPAVAQGVAAATWARPGAGRTPGDVPEHADDPLPALVLDDGPATFGVMSTRIALRLDGGFDVEEGGAIDEDRVMGELERTILFVCTGNTCRSPMAEAIARRLVEEMPYNGITTRVASAGVAAGHGVPASDQAVRAMRARGIDLSAHRSRPVSAAMVREAEVVYTMTPSHAEAVMTLAPESAAKVFPLDPRAVIEDPVGQGVEVYERTAARLEDLIRARLEELTV